MEGIREGTFSIGHGVAYENDVRDSYKTSYIVTFTQDGLLLEFTCKGVPIIQLIFEDAKIRY